MLRCNISTRCAAAIVAFALHFRHTATDFSQNDLAITTYGERAMQRNLPEAGRRC